ncbi:hypothetical protein K458DRAFT_475979 [Lentithecium fluviatile CBS 122367]|uniref:Aminoglycoside phosphotransferase domain-containing protein n=1 Tax=Lentithecium fluviatile CBS 122367 TaxID=1168545 RepID=A0A6G1JCF0_9PLEO|nr:hypothetical protein K458DRAFT_475979 [Lentithecium fluviatile CBS 122367]
MLVRSAGFPVPKIISYGEHPDTSHAPDSILTARIPGRDLGYSECMLQVMRKWAHPWGGERICSVLGTAVRSMRIPNHSVRPCEPESEFNDHLFYSLGARGFATRELFEETVVVAKRLQAMHHAVVFTHGDLKHHNVMSADWYPDYWEFTTPLRYGSMDYFLNALVLRLGGSEYLAELESEKALVGLTVDSWVW